MNNNRSALPYHNNEERPPWVEEATDPTFWDRAFGSYGDGYLEWVSNRYFWDMTDLRTIVDTRDLWDKRDRYLLDPLIVELNSKLDDSVSPAA